MLRDLINDFIFFLKKPQYSNDIPVKRSLVYISIFLVLSILLSKSILLFYKYPTIPKSIENLDLDLFSMIPYVFFYPIIEELAFRGGKYTPKFFSVFYTLVFIFITIAMVGLKDIAFVVYIVLIFFNLINFGTNFNFSSLSSIITSSIAFSMIHIHNFSYLNLSFYNLMLLVSILVLNHGIFSLFSQYIRHKSKLGLIGSILFHSVFNISIILIAFIFNK
jgi:hypothetical protein